MLLSQTYFAGELGPRGSLKMSLAVVSIAEVYKASREQHSSVPLFKKWTYFSSCLFCINFDLYIILHDFIFY